MFRKLRFGLVAIVSTSSLAADLEPYAAPPRMVSVYDWSGFYAGVNAGYGYATLNRELRDVFGNSSIPVNENLSGVSGGALVGANSQFGKFVVGGEIDIFSL
jgi:outer membrane immunogenic protein